MKHILLSIFTMLLPLMASAETVEIDGIYYYLRDQIKAVEVVDNPNFYTGNVVIPSSVVYNDVTYSVTYIRSFAFYNCTGLTSVTIPNSVTSLGSHSFYGCI